MNFRKMQLELIMKQIDENGRHKIEVNHAIMFISQAWKKVKQESIRN